MPENVRLQNLRDFTVQIRRTDNDAIVGTGIAVSTDGKIVTCAHVVEAAGIDPRDANGAEIGVYFPQARGGEEKKRRATVNCCFREHDDDMVLLQLVEGASPLAPEQIAVLGMADKSEGNPFRTYGYSPIGNYPAARGDGVILGSVEPPADRNLQVDPIQLKSRDIASGMSGAAVLDVIRNLVVGLVAERYYPEGAVQDDIGYGVDSKVLTFNPFDFELRGEALELKPAPVFRLDEDLFKQAMEIANYMLAHRAVADKYSWNNAPAVLTEWTGRDDLLKQITEDWKDPQKHVTGLIGFGGEGKSSLARKWVDSVIARSTSAALSINSATKQSPTRGEEIASQSTLAMTEPDGIFWWGFYENRSVDEFLEAALKYMSGGRIDPRTVPSSNLRAQIIGAMLGAGRYLFALDGLEVMQHQEGDQYGLLQNNDLRDLLTFFARPDNQSFCLITSRAPLLDLMDYTTYTHRDVDRLSPADGHALLKRLGVHGTDTELDKVVSDWDGHALTLSILAAYLVERYNGDVRHLVDVPVPEANEPRYERVHRVLRRYDEHLTSDEREFLKLFSVFRIPVQESAFGKVFKSLLKSLKKKDALQKLVSRLLNYRIIRYDKQSKTYTTHPLIRNHYFALFTKGDPAQGKAAHSQIKDYYLSIAGDTPKYPTLDDLKPLIEAIHHACQAGTYDEAFKPLFWHRLYQGERRVINYELGAYETELALMLEFFPNGDTSQEPKVSRPIDKSWVLNEVGICLMWLGHLDKAPLFFERHNVIALRFGKINFAVRGYINLAEVQAFLGALADSMEAASRGLELILKSKDNDQLWNALVRKAHTNYLRGEMELARNGYEQAINSLRNDSTTSPYLTGLRGINYADYLRRINYVADARCITEKNLSVTESLHWSEDISQCHRILGDLDADAGQRTSANQHYESALKIARGISYRPALIEALLARGRWVAKAILAKVWNLRKDEHQQSFNDLNEALGYCVESGYRIYEADVRVALGWAYLANGENQKAKESAERALQMSNEMGYYWGKVDAREVLERIERRE